MVSDILNPDLLKSIEGKKRELDSLRPFSAEIARKLEEQFIVEWTYNSNAIEGNTLTLKETELVINRGLTIGKKSSPFRSGTAACTLQRKHPLEKCIAKAMLTHAREKRRDNGVDVLTVAISIPTNAAKATKAAGIWLGAPCPLKTKKKAGRGSVARLPRLLLLM